jgi:predicted nuclease of predicted toxin-antitoxin system
MKLLFDENLSPKLVESLSDVFPGSAHVHHAGLGHSPDRAVWQFALDNGYTLVSKDSDFQELSLLLGYPPKVVWLRRGNCSTIQIEQLLRNSASEIHSLDDNAEAAFLILL